MNEFDNYADDFRARIRILSAAEGGRKGPTFNGIRWDLRLADEPDSEIHMIWPLFLHADGQPFPSGQELPLDRELPAQMSIFVRTPDIMAAFRERIAQGAMFFCVEGAHVVAAGVVTAITGLASGTGKA